MLALKTSGALQKLAIRSRARSVASQTRSISALVISTVWPEPQSSAAGMRTLNIIEAMKKEGKWSVACLSPSKENHWTEYLRNFGVNCRFCPDNDPIAFQQLFSALSPEIVIFDRFINEEKFGWQVQQLAPSTLRVIDTQDLHFLRKFRQDLVKETQSDWKTILNVKPDCTSKAVIRELSSILRSDLTLLISKHEMDLLRDLKEIPSHKLHYFPFAYDQPPHPNTSLGFEQRQHFAMLGNFRHPPNRDSLHYVAKEVWPLVRVSLDEKHALKTQLHVYGAYPDTTALSYTKKSDGLIVKGQIDDHLKMLGKYRVNLAALRFGAGLKGKVTDGWIAGTPVVGTSIAAEGLTDSNNNFGGLIANTPDEIADACKKLYEDESTWKECQSKGYQILTTEFDKQRLYRELVSQLTSAFERREKCRNESLISNVLWYHQFRSDEFFSRWIHLKNTISPTSSATEVRSPAERMGRLILNEMEKTNLSANRETETESFTTLFAMLEMHETAIKDIISFVSARGVQISRLTDEEFTALPDTIIRPRGPAEYFNLQSASGKEFIAVLSSGSPYVSLYSKE